MARPRPQNFRFVNGIPGNFGEGKPRLRPASAPVARRPSAAKAPEALSQKPRWIAYDRKVSASGVRHDRRRRRPPCRRPDPTYDPLPLLRPRR